MVLVQETGSSRSCIFQEMSLGGATIETKRDPVCACPHSFGFPSSLIIESIFLAKLKHYQLKTVYLIEMNEKKLKCGWFVLQPAYIWGIIKMIVADSSSIVCIFCVHDDFTIDSAVAVKTGRSQAELFGRICCVNKMKDRGILIYQHLKWTT